MATGAGSPNSSGIPITLSVLDNNPDGTTSTTSLVQTVRLAGDGSAIGLIDANTAARDQPYAPSSGGGGDPTVIGSLGTIQVTLDTPIDPFPIAQAFSPSTGLVYATDNGNLNADPNTGVITGTIPSTGIGGPPAPGDHEITAYAINPNDSALAQIVFTYHVN